MSTRLDKALLALGSNPTALSMPPRSPFGLIQEDLWPNEWKILVSCMMLNCTARRQVERVLPTFFEMWPTPEDLLSADRESIVNACRSLGFANRRTDALLKMTRAFIAGGWKHASELPGIGTYGARAWEIFCRCEVGNLEPNDGALRLYWKWACGMIRAEDKVNEENK